MCVETLYKIEIEPRFEEGMIRSMVDNPAGVLRNHLSSGKAGLFTMWEPAIARGNGYLRMEDQLTLESFASIGVQFPGPKTLLIADTHAQYHGIPDVDDYFLKITKEAEKMGINALSLLELFSARQITVERLAASMKLPLCVSEILGIFQTEAERISNRLGRPLTADAALRNGLGFAKLKCGEEKYIFPFVQRLVGPSVFLGFDSPDNARVLGPGIYANAKDELVDILKLLLGRFKSKGISMQ